MNKFSSIFGQILTLFPRLRFEAFVQETKAALQSIAKVFPVRRGGFVAMLFCQLGHAHSLREICGGLATCLGKVVHLGMKNAPSRSTLAYANEHRSWRLYEKLFYELLGICQTQFGPKHKFRFKNKLLTFDASLIKLCVTMFDWAKYRKTKGAIKLHLLLDHAGYLPTFVNITEGRVHELTVFKTLFLSRVRSSYLIEVSSIMPNGVLGAPAESISLPVLKAMPITRSLKIEVATKTSLPAA